MNSNDNKTPLEYYERSIFELTNTREQLQTELKSLKALKAELKSTQDELAKTKAELKEEIQAVKINFQEQQKLFSKSFKSFFVHANLEQEQNYTNNTNWETVVSYNLDVLTDSQVNVIAHGHGYTESYKAPLDIRIFINDEIYDDKNWGLGITHSHSWQTLVCIFIKVLTPGTHKIELKYRSRMGKKSVHLNYPSLLIMLSPINN
ncbi:hypothetical protein ACL6C3_19560 [Capilliphycus salinus ALCB114379]|uniref:hypothetical protein n=1 Tax=Capilliphycus salinus TaxID=2768948 RepID=UPI0039A5C377